MKQTRYTITKLDLIIDNNSMLHSLLKLSTKFLLGNFTFHNFWSFHSMAMAEGKILNTAVT
jgi:hypothetical protein